MESLQDEERGVVRQHPSMSPRSRTFLAEMAQSMTRRSNLTRWADGKTITLFFSLFLSIVAAWVVRPALGAPHETHYDRIIEVASERHGLDAALIKAVIRCESSFNPYALSPSGAQGLMQLMPGTQEFLGVADAFDPQSNVDGGARYLAMLKKKFHGDVVLMAAGYNAGPQAVVKAGLQVPPYAETRRYVKCVQAAHSRYSGGDVQLAVPPPPASKKPVERDALVMRPLRLSSKVARLGQRFTLHIEALNAGPYPSHGVVMLNYPEHLVSFMALHTSNSQDTTVRLPAYSRVRGAPAAAKSNTYQLLWRQWPDWQPGERRTAVITLVPRVPEDITMHLSVVLNTSEETAEQQRWSSVVHIPFATTAW